MQNPSTRLIQITDTHLYGEAGQTLVGMDCEEGLNDVLALVREHEDQAQAVLFTGDASQDGSEASYRKLQQTLAGLGLPQYWIPGNHDELPQMQAALGAQHECFRRSLGFGDWRVILLNSAVPGEVAGRLDTAELDGLRQALADSTEQNIMVCLHHNPVPVAAAWLQCHALQNPEALFELLDEDERVRLVLFGHIHHELETRRNGVLYLGCPSTCVQFHPEHDDFTLEDINPGYRWVELFADGAVKTGVRRVSGKRYNVDFSGTGY